MDEDVDLDHVVGDAAPVEGGPFRRRHRITARRVAESVFWFDVGGYHTTVLIGPESALLIDPLVGARTQHVQRIVRQRLGREISTVVYSHHHGDHIADAGDLLEGSGWRGQRRCVAAERCAREVARRARHRPADMTIPEGEPFDFEGLTLEAVELGGHTPDNTMWVVRGQAVAHAVDLVHPGQAEFFGFGSADLREYRAALVAILGAEWDHLIAGHGALGRRADVVVALAYFDDVWDAVERVRSRHPAKDFPQPTTHTYAWIARRTAVVLADVREQLAVSWGGLPGFEVVIGSQVERMLVQQEYYD